MTRTRPWIFFLKAYMLDENQFEVSLRLGRLYLNRDECETALRYLEKAVELEKESGAAHRFLGECRANTGMFEEAIRSYSDAIKANGNDAYSLSALGGLFFGPGKKHGNRHGLLRAERGAGTGKRSVQIPSRVGVFQGRAIRKGPGAIRASRRTRSRLRKDDRRNKRAHFGRLVLVARTGVAGRRKKTAGKQQREKNRRGKSSKKAWLSKRPFSKKTRI